MTGVMRCAWAVALVAGARASASELRTAAIGGVESAVADEATDFTLFNYGNTAGLVQLERKNRLDYALDGNGRSQENFDGSTYTNTFTTKTTSLRSPGGGYEGLTYWFSDHNAIRASLRFTSQSQTIGIDPDPPAPPPPPDPMLPSFPSGDQDISARYGRFSLGYAHRFGEKISVGVGLSPLSGTLTPKKQDKVKTDRTDITLFDYELSLAGRFPLEGGALCMGLSAHPYNDVPALTLLPGSPADVTALQGAAGFGGLTVKRTFETEYGGTQVTEFTPSGRTVGLQASWSGAAPLSAALALDHTAATVKQRVDTDTSALGPPLDALTKVDEGEVTAMTRTRWDLGLRYRFDLASGNAVRAGLGLSGAAATSDALNFPTSTAVKQTTKTSPTRFALGLAYGTKRGLTLGAGFESVSDTQTQSFPQDPAAQTVETKPIGTRVRLGGEYWFTTEWAARLGLILAQDRIEDNDPGTAEPGTDPSNPTVAATLLTLGGGYRGEALGLDLLVLLGSPKEDPQPDPPVTRTLGVYRISLAGRYLF